jgi:hypothetical protein
LRLKELQNGIRSARLKLTIEIIPRDEPVITLRLEEIYGENTERLACTDTVGARRYTPGFLLPSSDETHFAMALERPSRDDSRIDVKDLRAGLHRALI